MSRPPEFVLLNAVPGVDGDDLACYLGDPPWDMASSLPKKIETLFGVEPNLSKEQLRSLFLHRAVPANSGADTADNLLQVVDEFWQDMDSCYEDDWGRAARPAERRWVCEYIIARLRAAD